MYKLAHTSSCDIAVSDTTMCGSAFTNQSTWRMHTTRFHTGTGALTATRVRPFWHRSSLVAASWLSRQEKEQRRDVQTNALKRWVLTGGWRDASYRKEPKLGTAFLCVIKPFCDALERIAYAFRNTGPYHLRLTIVKAYWCSVCSGVRNPIPPPHFRSERQRKPR
jgi:hypothetical protein